MFSECFVRLLENERDIEKKVELMLILLLLLLLTIVRSNQINVQLEYIS